MRWAFIFGSVASDEDKIGSDIDLVSYSPKEFARKRAQGDHFIRSVLAQSRVDVIGGDRDA